jgi:hypothetical protein
MFGTCRAVEEDHAATAACRRSTPVIFCQPSILRNMI